MGFVFRERVRASRRATVNLSGRGASVSERVGPVTVNSRGRLSVRILPWLSFRIGGAAVSAELCDFPDDVRAAPPEVSRGARGKRRSSSFGPACQ